MSEQQMAEDPGGPSDDPGDAGDSPGMAIVARGLTKRYERGPASVTALDGIELDIGSGGAVALVGPSGSGKSTLLHLIAAMDRPSAGSLIVGGTEVSSLGAAAAARFRRRVGFVFQAFHLLDSLSAIDNVLVPLLPARQARARGGLAMSLIERVGLAERARHLPAELSGGEQQRVAIARALVNEPRLLLADEPTGNLDSATGAAIVELLLEVRRDSGATLVVATHDERVAASLDRRVRLSDGRIAG